MTGIDAIRAALESTKSLLGMYLSDLSDADLLVRPTPSANHTAWQLGHLITADKFLIAGELPDASFPELPKGFVANHSKETAAKDGPAGFLTTAEYLALFQAMRSAAIATLNSLSDTDLDRPSVGRLAAFAPRLGDMFLLVSTHTLMHAGQITVVRRMLGKPVLF